MNPDPFTLRELMQMLEGRRKEEWIHTASLIQYMINVQMPRSGQKKFEDIYPYNEKREDSKQPDDMVMIRELCQRAFGQRGA